MATKFTDLQLIIDRSFSSLTAAAREMASFYTHRFIGSIAGLFFESNNWRLNTAEKLKKLDPENVTILQASNDQALVASSLSKKVEKKEKLSRYKERIIKIKTGDPCSHINPINEFTKDDGTALNLKEIFSKKATLHHPIVDEDE